MIWLIAATLLLCHFAANWKSDAAFAYPDVAGVSSTIGKHRCRVSAEETQNMTTRALVETVMTYPYLIDMYAFDSADLWFRQAQNLPMFQELLARKDCLEVLKAEAEKAGDDWMQQMHYATLMGCVERALQK